MRHKLTLLTGIWMTLAGRAATAEDPYVDSVRPVLERYCGSCHAADGDNPHPFLAADHEHDLQHARSTWASVAAQLRNRTMPPADEDQPTEADRLRIARWVEETLRATACNGVDYAGWIPARRLNRIEYSNTIRDLMGVELGFSRTLPVDSGGGEGFDNHGETLFLPPLLLERYLEAAQQIVDTAIIVPSAEWRFTAADLLPAQEMGSDNFRRIPAGGSAFVLVPSSFESDYQIIIGAYPDADQLTVHIDVDGIRAGSLTFRGYGDREAANQEETAIRLTRGLHAITIHAPADRALRIVRVRVNQQLPVPAPGVLAIHRRLIGLAPGEVPVEARAVARDLLRRFVSRAFRRPVLEKEVDRFLGLYDRAAARGDAFEQRVKLMLQGVLVSPEFLFRIEARPATEELTPLTDHELATRLSYFLWSTMPDEQLRLLALNGELQNEDSLCEQVDRMLKDPKADEFYSHFIGQWLGTRDVGGRVAPTDNSIQHFYTPDVATDMRKEAVLLFRSIVQGDRSLLELLDSDYQFMTGRLAKFYGIDGADKLVQDEFQRVQLTDRRRGGVLGLGAVLALTSHTSEKETSPVLRGAWVLDTLLGTPVPAPPPDIPALDTKAAKQNDVSLREMLQSHRSHATCAACHDLIDPIGFGLENFDYLGRWRDKVNGKKIDTAGSLPSGESFDGPMQLKHVLLDRERDFLRQISRKVLGYALGRSLVDEDQCTIETLVDRLLEQHESARSLIINVVLSTQFRYKQR